MKKTLEIFKEDNGQFSSIRVMSFIALVIGAVLSFKGADFDIILIWLVGAFAPKAIQKIVEKKVG